MTSFTAKDAGQNLGDFKYDISACLFDDDLTIKIVTRNNLPPVFEKVFLPKDKIGDSGPTIHAEIFALQSGVSCEGLSVAITDPPCPNCTKQLIMSGIKNIYILEAGFSQGMWYNSVDESRVARKRYFHEVSLALAKYAGLGVFVIGADGRIVETLCTYVEKKPSMSGANSASYAFIKKDETRLYEQYTYGMDSKAAAGIRAKFEDVDDGLRYRLMIDPLSHLLSHCARHGKNLAEQEIYISEIPTSRCIVNAVGSGVKRLSVPQKYQTYYAASSDGFDGNDISQKTASALQALNLLAQKGVIEVTFENL